MGVEREVEVVVVVGHPDLGPLRAGRSLDRRDLDELRQVRRVPPHGVVEAPVDARRLPRAGDRRGRPGGERHGREPAGTSPAARRASVAGLRGAGSRGRSGAGRRGVSRPGGTRRRRSVGQRQRPGHAFGRPERTRRGDPGARGHSLGSFGDRRRRDGREPPYFRPGPPFEGPTGRATADRGGRRDRRHETLDQGLRNRVLGFEDVVPRAVDVGAVGDAARLHGDDPRRQPQPVSASLVAAFYHPVGSQRAVAVEAGPPAGPPIGVRFPVARLPVARAAVARPAVARPAVARPAVARPAVARPAVARPVAARAGPAGARNDHGCSGGAQVGRDGLRDARTEPVVLGLPAQVGERQHDHGRRRRCLPCQDWGCLPRRGPRCLRRRGRQRLSGRGGWRPAGQRDRPEGSRQPYRSPAGAASRCRVAHADRPRGSREVASLVGLTR